IEWEGLREPVQVVWRQAIIPIEEVELDSGAGDITHQLYELYNPRHHRIDIRQAPLMRVYVTEDKENSRWLMMHLLHHLMGDHSTDEMVQEEIKAHLLGQADRLPPPLPFRNLVAEARLVSSRKDHDAYFTMLLGDVDEPTLPFGLADVHGDG